MKLTFKYAGTRLYYDGKNVYKKRKEEIDDISVILSDAYMFGRYELPKAIFGLASDWCYFTYVDNDNIICDDNMDMKYYINEQYQSIFVKPKTISIDDKTYRDIVSSKHYDISNEYMNHLIVSVIITKDDGKKTYIGSKIHIEKDYRFQLIDDILCGIIKNDQNVTNMCNAAFGDAIKFANQLFIYIRYKLKVDLNMDNMIMPSHMTPDITDTRRRELIGDPFILSLMDNNYNNVYLYNLILSILYKRKMSYIDQSIRHIINDLRSKMIFR